MFDKVLVANRGEIAVRIEMHVESSKRGSCNIFCERLKSLCMSG